MTQKCLGVVGPSLPGPRWNSPAHTILLHSRLQREGHGHDSKQHVLESVRGRYRSFWKPVSDICASPAFTFSKAYHFLEAKITMHFAAEVCIFCSLRKACRPGLPQRRLPSPGRQLSEADLSFYRRPHKSECISRNKVLLRKNDTSANGFSVTAPSVESSIPKMLILRGKFIGFQLPISF